MRKQHFSFKYVKNFICICACMVGFLTVSLPSVAGEEEWTVMDSYLDGTGNVFTEELDGIQKSIDALTPLISTIEANSGDDAWEKAGISASTGTTHVMYTYHGQDITISKDMADFGWDANLLFDLNGKFQLKNGSSYTQIERNNFEGLCARLKDKRDSLQSEYNNKSMVYESFSLVGSDSGKGFQANVRSNGAFSSWSSVTSSLYGTGTKTDVAVSDDGKVGKVEKAIATPIGDGAFTLYKWMKNWNIDLTIDGVVFGRLAPSYKGTVDFTHFGLEENNPYGIVAASAYYVLRRLVLSVLPVLVMIFLIRQLFLNTQKGRAQLKEMAGNFLLIIAMLFIAPYLINILILVRDGVLKVTGSGMASIFRSVGLGDGVGSSVFGTFYGMYMNRKSFLNAILLAASAGSGFVFLVSYLKIALLLCGSVAILPLVLFFCTWNRKLLKDWWNIFLPNLCVPVVDLILLQVPTIVMLIFKKYGGSGGGVVLGLVVLIIIWNILVVRDRIIRLLGFEGLGRNGSGLLGAAMMAMRAFGGSLGGGKHGTNQTNAGVGEGGISEREGIAMERAKMEQMQAAQQRSLPDMSQTKETSYSPDLLENTDNFLQSMDESHSGSGLDYSPADIFGDGEDSTSMSPVEQLGDGLSVEDTSGSETALGMDGMEIPDGETEAVMAENTGTLNEVISEAVPGTEDGMVDEMVQNDNSGEASGAGQFIGESGDGNSNAAGTESDGKPFDYYNSSVEEIAKHEYDGGFADSLSSEVDRARYENLLHMDGINYKMAQNDAVMQTAGFTSLAQSEGEKRQIDSQIGRIDRHIRESENRLHQMGDVTSGAYKTEAGTLTELQSHRNELVARKEQLNRAEQCFRENNGYRRELETRAGREENYASTKQIGGMDGRVYTSARDFETQTKLAQVRKEFADYSNFDSKRFEGILSPEERESFYQERLLKQRAQSLRRVAGIGASTLGKGAVFAAASTLSMYSGPSSVTVGLAATQGATGIVNHGKEVVDAVGDAAKATYNARGIRRPGAGKKHRPGDGVTGSQASVSKKSPDSSKPQNNPVKHEQDHTPGRISGPANAEEKAIKQSGSSAPNKDERAGELSEKSFEAMRHTMKHSASEIAGKAKEALKNK